MSVTLVRIFSIFVVIDFLLNLNKGYVLASWAGKC